MSRKSLVKTTALLALFIMAISPVIAISPVMAMTKEYYWEHVQFTAFGAPSKVWFADGIMHLEDMHWSGSYTGTLGTGTMDVWYEHLMLNTVTGKGTCVATWLITIGVNTMSGSANGKITGGLSGISEGYFRGTHGTGAFERIEKMGTYVVSLTAGTLDAEGVIIYHG